MDFTIKEDNTFKLVAFYDEFEDCIVRLPNIHKNKKVSEVILRSDYDDLNYYSIIISPLIETVKIETSGETVLNKLVINKDVKNLLIDKDITLNIVEINNDNFIIKNKTLFNIKKKQKIANTLI